MFLKVNNRVQKVRCTFLKNAMPKRIGGCHGVCSFRFVLSMVSRRQRVITRVKCGRYRAHTLFPKTRQSTRRLVRFAPPFRIDSAKLWMAVDTKRRDSVVLVVRGALSAREELRGFRGKIKRRKSTWQWRVTIDTRDPGNLYPQYACSTLRVIGPNLTFRNTVFPRHFYSVDKLTH